MIYSIRFKSGYAAKLPGIRKKTFSFKSRLNLLTGPNGSGKSTILRALADAAGCGSGGWGEKTPGSGKEILTCSTDFFTVERDGRPVFFQDCYTDSEKSFIDPSIFEKFSRLRSTGEKRIGLINELINHIEDRFITYKLKKEERPALVLDEIDNHIGFAGQSLLWKHIFPLLLKKYQLIVSTHSIFPLLLNREKTLREDNLISLVKGYEEFCMKELAFAIDYYNRQKSREIKKK